MEYFISILIGYLLGSIPTAYLLLKKTNGIDITKNGSGNVGAYNSMEVSNSKLIGGAVLVIDLIKGMLAVFLIKIFFGESFILAGIGLSSAVFGHCYSPWLKFKGGRGLATAAGGSILLAPQILLIWAILWFIAYIYKKHIHFGNISATILTAILILTSSDVLNKYSTPPSENEIKFTIVTLIILAIIMSRHIKPFKEYLDFQKEKIKDR